MLGLTAVIWFGMSTATPDEPAHGRPATLVAVLLPVLLLLVGGTTLTAGSLGGLTWVFAATAAGIVATAVAIALLVVEPTA